MPVSTAHPASPDETCPRPTDQVFVLSPDDVQVLDVRHDDRHQGRRSDEPVQQVSGARGSHTQDVARRMRGYAISMGIRTLCVLGAVLLFPHWYAWLFVPGAVVLPYVAVVVANAGRERAPRGPAAMVPAPSSLPVLRTERVL